MSWQYWRMFSGDFERDTGDLSLAEVGAYIRLLNHYYSTRKPLPNDFTKLYRICGAVSDREKACVRTVIEGYFEAKTDGFQQRRVEQELLHQKSVSAVQSTKRRNNGSSVDTSIDNQRIILPVPVPDKHIKPLSLRSHRLPEDWIPKESHYELGKELSLIVDMQFHKFRDYFLGKGEEREDWDRAFSYWMRNERRNVHGKSGNYISPAQQRVNNTRQNIANVLRKQALAFERANGDGREQQDGTVRSDDRGVDPRILELLPGKVI